MKSIKYFFAFLFSLIYVACCPTNIAYADSYYFGKNSLHELKMIVKSEDVMDAFICNNFNDVYKELDIKSSQLYTYKTFSLQDDYTPIIVAYQVQTDNHLYWIVQRYNHYYCTLYGYAVY